MNLFINKVFNGDALALLRVIPTASIDAVITDAMYGTAKNCRYDWGLDPARGDPVKHWQYHEPIYQECRRVLRPGGILAWGQGIKFAEHFPGWFGPHGLWPLARRGRRSRNWISCHLWVVQTKKQQPIPLPTNYKLIEFDTLPPLTVHPCPKPVEEMKFLIEALTKPGQIVLDCFCGLGSTLVAAQQLGRRWIGCDKSRAYCQWTMKELDKLPKQNVASRHCQAREPTMLIEMNRFLTRAEIERLYQMPPDVLPTVMASVPVAHRGENGEPYFVESDVDRAVDAFAASASGRRHQPSEPAPKGRPGRRNATADIAVVANELKAQGKTWKEILAACKSRFPGRVKSLEQVRTIWRRRFEGKK